MSIRRIFFFLLVAIAFLLATGMPTTSSDLIVGRNVNMVSGTDFIGGDPYLQRQNEPSIAVSTRNPLHLLAGANDYRTIDIPYQDELPGIPEGTAARDAWLGVFKSIDGGQSWTSTLLPGYPQDTSIEGTSSPISGYDAACDPVVRAGTNGLFYYSGIAFNRAERGAGVVFVARFIDNNNIEGSDTIEYVDTHIVDQGNAGQFLDMPSIAVDIPRNMTNTGMIRTAGDLSQNIPCGNVYITYTVFLGNTIENIRSKLLFARSTDCGVNWGKPIKVSESQHILQRPTIAIDPSDLTGGTIYLAFRRFAHGKAPDAIVIVKSVDGGQTFTKPIEVATFDPFDQGTSTYSFRSNSYPTLTVDGGGIVYLAWAQRIGGPDGFARIVIKTSPDGIEWSSPAIKADDSAEARGHQFMPSLTYAGGKLMIAWYDQRDDLACLADPTNPNKYFTKYIEDSEVRHTIDVRAALIEPGLTPLIYPSERISRYLHILELDGSGDWIEDPPGSGFAKVQQAEFNPPNYTLFQLGTVPFYGDWLEIVPSTPLLNSTSGMSQAPSFHVVWTDNRDVRPPGGNWWVFPWPTSNYNAPDSGHNRVDCLFGDLTGVRNQNIYTASITSGILVGSLGNTKPADDVQHTYIIFVKNTTSGLRSFRLTVDASNASFRQNIVEHRLPTLDVEVPPYSTVTRTVFVDPPQTQIRIDVVEIVEPGGGVKPGGLTDSILLNPDPTNPPVYDPYNPEEFLYYEYHNPRVENPRVENYDLTSVDEMNPRVLNPRVENPRVLNPRVLNPRVENLGLLNPRVENISFLNPEMENPRVENPRVENTAMADVVWEVGNEGNTTSIYTLTMLSEAVVYDAEGNPSIPDENIYTQILVYKIHTTPATTPEDDCILGEEHSDELLLNITNPRVENPRVWNPRVENPRVENPRVENPRVENATFALAPGEEAYVTWRIWDDEVPVSATSGGLRTASAGGLSIGDILGPVDANGVPEKVGAALSAHAANQKDVEQGIFDPPVSMSANVAPEIGYSPSSLDFTASVGGPDDSLDLFINNKGEGILDYTLTIEYETGLDWLSVAPNEGQSIAGDLANLHVVTVLPSGLLEGTYKADIVIEAPGASNTPQTVSVTLTIYLPTPAPEIWRSPSSMTFEATEGGANPSSQTLEVKNSGGDTLSYAITDDAAWLDVSPTIGTSTGDPANTHTVSVDISSQSAAASPYTATITITAAGASNTPQTVSVTLMIYPPPALEEWVARYNGPASGPDNAHAIAVDSSGNVYVTGLSWGGSGTAYDYYTVKYNSSGEKLWDARYNGPGNGYDQAYAIAVDSFGNVYVTGRSEGSGTWLDYYTVKYNSAGEKLWDARYNGPGNWSDQAHAIAIDSSGNVYVTGYGSATNEDYTTIKYQDLGTSVSEVWVATYNGPGNGYDQAYAIAIDSFGNVYVTGWSEESGTGYDYYTVKYNSAGEKLWDARYDGPGNDSDMANAIAIDSSGNVYVTGLSWGGSGTAYDYYTVKYNSAGEKLWDARYNGPGNGLDQAYAIAVDSSGNVYVTGFSEGSGTSNDYYTVKYNSAGEKLWDARYNGPANGLDHAYAIAVDSFGNVYVTGGSLGSGTSDDYYTVKYNSSGEKLWDARYDGPENDSDMANAIAIDSTGNVYLTGQSIGSETSNDYATIKYSQSFPSTLIITTEKLDIGYAGLDYAATIWAFGGSGSRTWSITSGSLPPGLNLNTTTGVISGTPTSTNIYDFQIKVQDGTLFDFKDLSITIILPDTATKILVETADDGTGIVAPAQNVPSGTSITVYAIARDAADNFLANVEADSWSLINKSGDVVDGDLVPAGDMKSAVFTANLTGSANIHAERSGLTSTDSETITIIAGEINIKQNTTDIPDDTGSYNFGSHAIGSNTDVTFIIENLGGAELTVGSVSLSGTDAGEFSVFAQPASPVAPSGSTTFVIRFSPTSAGAKTADISIDNNDSDENPYNITLNGTGEAVPAPEINIKQNTTDIPDAGSYNFGSHAVGSNTDVTFIIENLGGVELTVGSVSLSGTDAGEFSVFAQPASPVAPSGSTTFVIRFSPTSAGAKTADISIGNNDSDENPYDITITGTGVSEGAPEINVKQGATDIPDDGSYDFGSHPEGSQTDVTFTIENIGTADLVLDPRSVEITGTDSDQFRIEWFPNRTISPGSNTTFDIRFFPTSSGPKTALIYVRHNDVGESPYNITINGTGVSGDAEMNFWLGNTWIEDGGRYSFGPRAVGSNTDIYFRIVNTGSTNALTISDISLSGDSEFSIIYSPDPPFSIAAQTSDAIGIQFSPTSEGTKTTSISIANNDLDESPYNITFIGSGSQGLYFSDFEADALNEPPQTGGANQPSSYSVKEASVSVLVQSSTNGLSTKNVVITLDDPNDLIGDWGTVDYAFGPYDSGIVCIEATVAINQLANLFFCATNVPSALITRLNTNFRDEIWGHSLMSEYQPNTPFRVRQYVNMDTNTWSAVIDDEMNGFDDDQMFTGMPFTQSVSQIGKFLAYILYGSHGSAPVSIAYDDIFIKEVHFTPTGSLNTGRYSHTAARLDDGKVIVIGGNPGWELDTAELYDPASGTFSYTTGNLNEARRQHATVKLDDGKILVCGGIGTGYTKLSSAEIYDPSTGAFTSTGSLNTARYDHTATLLNNGKVLICGGTNGTITFTSAEIYDPGNGTFSYTTDSMSTARWLHTATLLQDGRVFICGGLAFDSAEIYDPSNGTFTETTGSMSTKRYYHTATLLNNGKVFITGGIDGVNVLSSAEIYDPSSGFSTTGSMSVARMNHRATLLSNGKVLVCGGRSDANDVSTRHCSAELYDPVAGTYSPTDSMSVARDFFTAVLLNSGKVLVCGGLRETGMLNSAELYDPWD